ncbi:MAG: glutamine--tRNA ligase/YqeY domain fusion protein [Candidatus Improbicoccus devescovinae]|nr:MAG: glutamine--tRNA ligase/YqeY domain fusion protein [Candidatus Improbicoccus devescovinae]
MIQLDNNSEETNNFLVNIIKKDFLENGKYFGNKINTRFPPEPNGFLHIGHAKAICIDFTMAEKFGGVCNLRMDDTNPAKEEMIYVNSIQEDIRWLGFDWEDRFYFASDYFPEMFEIAENLIRKGLAYVCELTQQQTKDFRGDLKIPAKSPFRDRPISESIKLFSEMKNGNFSDAAMTLRAKIDLNSSNFNMRDPVIYRIMHKNHHRTGDKWCIYPMYDFAHPIEDALEGITHSLCSLEFENHRPLYDWVINNAEIRENKNLRPILSRPTQIEFSRLNLDYTVMSKRKLITLVNNHKVSGWDDPRMPTISGLRRRGYTPSTIKKFCSKIGISKSIGYVETEFLENCLRDELNSSATRVMAVLDPILLVITNFDDEKTEEFDIPNNPTVKNSETHKITFSKELFIERDDFKKVAQAGYHRLYPDNIVRLKSAYAVKCTGFDEDSNGNISKVYCEYFPESHGGANIKGTKIKCTIHWVSVKKAISARVNLYEKLFLIPDPEAEGNMFDQINPDSLKILDNCKLEEFMVNSNKNVNYQFMRQGYFVLDPEKTEDARMIFNRSVTLKSK